MAQQKITFVGIPESRKVDSESLRRVLLADHDDAAGKTWEAGTEYEPIQGGYDHALGSRYVLAYVDVD